MDEVGVGLTEDLRVQLLDMGPAPIPVPRETLERWRAAILTGSEFGVQVVKIEIDHLLK